MPVSASKLVTLAQLQAQAERVKQELAKYTLASELGSLAKKSEISEADLSAALKSVIDGKMDAADSMTTEAINSAIATAIAKSAHARFEKVEKVPSNDAAQENILYLVMNTTTKHYDIYAKIKGSSDSYTMELLDDTTVDLSGKVDKVAGKGLSTNDYTTAEKTKLAGIAEGANKYVHPSYTAKTSGLYKVTVDATGHVSAVAAVTKGDITALGIPGQDTTYPEATTAKAGLMSAADKTKLDGMDTIIDKAIANHTATDAEVTEMLTEVFGATA